MRFVTPVSQPAPGTPPPTPVDTSNPYMRFVPGGGPASGPAPGSPSNPNSFVADNGFKLKVASVASVLGADPNHLMQAMKFESGLNPKAKNPNSSATGLIQFMDSTARGLGTTTKDIYNMSAMDQMDLVQKYLSRYTGRLNNFGDVYMAIHWPAAVGKTDDYILYSKGTKAYSANHGLDLNQDGVVTRGEAVARAMGLHKAPAVQTFGSQDQVSEAHYGSQDMVPSNRPMKMPEPNLPPITGPQNPVAQKDVKENPVFIQALSTFRQINQRDPTLEEWVKLRHGVTNAVLSANKTAQYQSQHPSQGTAGAMSPDQLSDFNVMEQGDKAKEKRISATPAQRAIAGAEEATTRLSEAIKPYAGAVGEALYGTPGRASGEMGAEMGAGILTMPVHAAAEITQLSDPSVSLKDKAGAAANLIILLGGADAGNIAESLDKGLVKVVDKFGSIDQRAAIAIRDAVRSGVKPQEIASAIRGNPLYMKPPKAPPVTEPNPFTIGGESGDITQYSGNKRPVPTPAYGVQDIHDFQKGQFLRDYSAQRQTSLLQDVERLIQEQKGAGSKYGPLVRELRTAQENGTIHPAIAQMGEDEFYRQNPQWEQYRNASQIESPETLHGDVRTPTGEGQGQVPVQEGGPGVQQNEGVGATGTRPEAQGQAQEVGGTPNPQPPVTPVESPSGGQEAANAEGSGITHTDTAKLREEMGWEPYEKTPKSDAKLFAEAQRYRGQEEVIAERIKSNRKRVPTDAETLALSARIDELKGQMDAAYKAGDMEGYNNLEVMQHKLADALDEAGSRQGRAFRARQFVANQIDHTDPESVLFHIRRKKVETGDLPQTPEAEAETRRVVGAHAEANQRANAATDSVIENYYKNPKPARDKIAQIRINREKIRADLRASLKSGQASFGPAEALGSAAKTSYHAARLALNYIEEGALTLKQGIERAIADAKSDGADLTYEDIRNAIDDIYTKEPKTRSELQERIRQGQIAKQTAVRLARKEASIERTGTDYPEGAKRKIPIKKPTKTAVNLKRLDTELKKWQSRLDNGDFSEAKPNQRTLSIAEQNAKRQVQITKQAVLDNIAKNQRVTPWQIAQRTQRAFVLSGPAVFAKLGVASGSHMMASPVEDLIAHVASKTGLGKGSIEVEASTLAHNAAAVKEFFGKETWIDAWNKAAGRGGSLEHTYGVPKARGLLNLTEDLHAAIKTPLQRATFKRESLKMTDFLAKQGVDVSSPEAMHTITQYGYQKSLEALLLNDTKVTKLAEDMFRSIRERFGVNTEAAVRTLSPIVKVPLNFMARTAEYAGGAEYAAIKSIGAKLAGREMSTIERDAIIRAAKRGTVGTGLLVLGFYYPDLMDDLPTWIKHTPIAEMLTLGGAIRKGYDSGSKEGSVLGGIGKGAFGAAKEYTRNFPGQETMQIGGVLTAPGDSGWVKAQKIMADYILSIAVPQFVVQMGKAALDKQEVKDNKEYYKSSGFWDEIKKSAPWLRQTLPTAPVPGKSDSSAMLGALGAPPK